jgi:NitT/TauT family transport system substrate-binding protein
VDNIGCTTYRAALGSVPTRRGTGRRAHSGEEEDDVRFLSPPFRFGALAIAGALVAACTAAATPSPAPTAAPTAGPTGAASPTAATGELPKPELTTLRLGFSAAGEMSQFAGIQANMLKIYDKYGITTTVNSFEGEAKAVAALQAGQIDVGIAGPGSAMSSWLTDVPLIIFALNAGFLTDDIVCGPNIKTPADVKGKKLAISTFGGTSHAAALLGLKAMGLTATEAQITQIGGQGTRIAAVVGGSADCAVVDKSVQSEMIKQGLNIVAKVYEPPQPFGRSSTAVTKSFMEKNPNTVLVAAAAILEGGNMIWEDPTGTAQRFAQWLQTDVARTTPIVQDYLGVGNRSLMWTDEVFTNGKKILATVNPDVIDVDITKPQDKSILKKLLDGGFYAKINNPATCVTWTTTKGC